MNGLLKVGSAEINSVMLKAASIMRSQQEEINRLREGIAAQERKDHAQKIASTVIDRGIMAREEAQEYAAELALGDKDLSMVEDLVSRTAGGVPLGASLKKTASANSDGDTDVLTSFLLSSDI